MRIEYTRLFDKIKSEGMTQKIFMENANIKAGTLNKLLHGESVTTEIICRICDYFRCMPDEIMEFIPEKNYPENIKYLSSCKSPHEMFGALLKTYYAEKNKSESEE